MIHIQNIGFRYQGRRDEADYGPGNANGFSLWIDELSIPNHGVTAVLGPSGSGKSTFLGLLSGFIPAEPGKEGEFRFLERDMLHNRRHAPGDTAYVFQSSMLLQSAHSVLNALQGKMAVRSGSSHLTAQDAEWFRCLQLDASGGHLSRRAHSLSGGEAQRFAVLRALLADPKVILCDEPTSSLDANNAERVMTALCDWSKRKGRPVIWVTHNREQAAAFADHFVIFSKGQVVRPTASVASMLQSSDVGERYRGILALTGEVSALPAGTGCQEPKGERGAHGLALPARAEPTLSLEGRGAVSLPGRTRFLLATASALSTDSLAGRRREERNAGAHLSSPFKPAVRFLSDAGERGAPEPSAPAETPAGAERGTGGFQFLRDYSRWGLDIVLLCILLQIFATVILYQKATKYYDEKLQDPAVARLMFEHVVDSSSDAEPGPNDAKNLHPHVIGDLQAAIASRIDAAGDDALADRVSVFGRRHGLNRFRLLGLEGNCGGWTELDTAIVDPSDPLLGQMERRDNWGSGKPFGAQTVIISGDIADLLVQVCDVDFSKPVRGEWTLTHATIAYAVPVEVSVVAEKMPPFHPYNPKMIVFEPTLIQNLAKQTNLVPEAYRYANAYFPLEYFDEAQAVIEQNHYRVRTDSRAAVKNLVDMTLVVKVVPTIVIVVNMIVAAIVVKIIVDHLLEINRRVFALFNAYGYRMADIMVTLGTHLLPAFGMAVVLAGVIASGLALLPRFPGALEGVGDHALEAFGISVLLLAAIVTVIFLETVRAWWMASQSDLMRLLKD